ncbi:MAG: TIGR03364 family FAD-dependent oxidoreductase [Rhodospirillaceae bacterium]
MGRSFDVAIVGAGIVGLAHALAAARIGKRVVVIDRDAQANGASVRNFGFVTVTGQAAGACWLRAMRSRAVWADVAPQAGIAVEHEGLAVAASSPEAVAVLEAFLATEMGRDCALLNPAQAAARVPGLRADAVQAVLWSPHELRVESRDAVPKLADWLAAAHGVRFIRSAAVRAVAPPAIETSEGRIEAETAIVCPGDDLVSLFPERIRRYGVVRCKLQMLRVVPNGARPRLGAAVMSDLGLIRYQGYSTLAETAALRARLTRERPGAVANGVHLIAVQSADGSLVVGDSHHYGDTPDPFASAAVEGLILEALDAVLALPGRRVAERWIGTYSSCADRLMFVDSPSDAVRLVMVTSGTGASTAFAIAEEVVAELYGRAAA